LLAPLSIGIDLFIVALRSHIPLSIAYALRSACNLFSGIYVLWCVYGTTGVMGTLLIYTCHFLLVHGIYNSLHFLKLQENKFLKASILCGFWGLSISFILDSSLLTLFDERFLTYDLPINRFLADNFMFSRSGTLRWSTGIKFLMLRSIEYATHVFYSNDTITSVSEFMMYLQYVLYAPLSWQGPLIGFKDFIVQCKSRFKVVKGKLRIRPINKPFVIRLCFLLFMDCLIKEIIQHNWFVDMHWKRKSNTRLRAPELWTMCVLMAIGAYCRMCAIWRIFSILSCLDRIDPPDNFPKCIFRCSSVQDVWRNFNASVHEWILRNMVTPLSDLGVDQHVSSLICFVYMIYWHGGGFGWSYFYIASFLFILFEKLIEDSNLKVPFIIHHIGSCLAWTVKFLVFLVTWLNICSPMEDKEHFIKAKEMMMRSFIDDSVEEPMASSFGINNTQLYFEESLFGTIRLPTQVLISTFFICFVVRHLIYVFDTLDIQAQYEPEAISSSLPRQQQSHKKLREIAKGRAVAMISKAATICHVLQHRANDPNDANRDALVWCNSAGQESQKLSFKHLHNRAAVLASVLTDHYGLHPGDRAVLVYPPGLEFVVAIFACMYARVIAVPVYPPKPNETNRDLVFRKVLDNCNPSIILTDMTYSTVRNYHLMQGYVHHVVGFIPILLFVILHHIEFKLKRHFVFGYSPDAEWRTDGISKMYLGVAVCLYLLVVMVYRHKHDSKTSDYTWYRTDSILEKVLPARVSVRDFNLEEVTPDTIAYLQYTSGSTADPKGVKISHSNLMHQGYANQISFGCTGPGETAVNWCPQYHDLGLVVCIFSGVFAGIRLVAFSPLDFLKNPLLWLRLISKYQASFSAAPNFAYGYAARKARTNPDQVGNLNLKSWKIAGNGGEPVRVSSLDSFEKEFSKFGFERTSYFPCFGLAEHTILATGRIARRMPTILEVDTNLLAKHVIKICSASCTNSSSLVGCGEPFPGVDITITDPETMAELPHGSVGEVLISSPSVGHGYWNLPDKENKEIFGFENHPQLRTGDLGFLHNKELFICGRLKDLIIIDGKNIYPQDIENTAEVSSGMIFRTGSSVSFMTEDMKIVVVAELRRDTYTDNTQVRKAVMKAYIQILQNQGVQVHRFVVVHAGTVPKTSSGKVQRRKVLELVHLGALQNVVLDEVCSSLNTEEFNFDQPNEDPLFFDILFAIMSSNLVGVTYHKIESVDDEIINMPLKKLLEDDRGVLSSLDAVQFAGQLEIQLHAIGIDQVVRSDTALRFRTVGELARDVYQLEN